MLCSKEECTGCFGCFNVCPKKAIIMKEQEFGNIYPIIDNEKCIKCGLCEKICPQLNQEKMKFSYPKKIYAMYSKNNKIREESTSGGIATLISKYIIENNGVVYGAGNIFNNNFFSFLRINDVNDLYKIQGSKYVHCYIDKAYRNVREDLNNNKLVLFVGTPCQISGLKMFLSKDYKNLVTIDIICHGVPSQKVLFEDLKYSFKIGKKDFEYITFRDSNGYHIKIYKTIKDYFEKKVYKSKYANLDPYYKNFLRGNIYRENCYNCNYAKKERISDITIGDFWGLDKKSKIYDNAYKGISSVIVLTDKGLKIIEEIFPLVEKEERTYKEVYLSNGQLNAPMERKKQYQIFKENYEVKGYKKTYRKMNLTKDYIKYNNIIYNLLKKINND